jgi:hypothetical protein
MNSKNTQSSENTTQFPPLPKGEGRGEGEGDVIILNVSKRSGIYKFRSYPEIYFEKESRSAAIGTWRFSGAWNLELGTWNF